MKNGILDLICCPQNQEKFELKDGELFTSSTSYPLFSGIPWLNKNPEFSYLEWATKINIYLEEEVNYISYLTLLINQETNEKSKERFEKILTAKKHNIEIQKNLLAEFLIDQKINLTPSNQQIHSYSQHIFRDWCWDSDENDIYANFIQQTLNDETKNVLILGAGACGLSYKLANVNKDINFISLDHNPYLIIAASKIFNGEKLNLYDYSFFPNKLENTNRVWEIQKEKLAHDNHQFILGSYPDLPFPAEAFDLIIAPWFFDILEENLEMSLDNARKYLKPQGSLIQIGPANVHHKDLDKQFTHDEMINFHQSFFEKTESKIENIKYLTNPIESFSRSEDVLFVKSSKKNDFTKDYKEKNSKEIKFSPAFQEYKLTNETLNRILKHIDKDMDYDELATKLENEFGFQKDQALFYAESFYKKIQLEI